ncbi:MAG: hypothetical protein ACO200_12910 [Steroidobacteraceae bacterium]
MHKISATVCLLGSLSLFATLAPADEPATAAVEPTKNERRVCKSVVPTGTRLPKKTCLTVAQWDEARKIAQEATEKGQSSAQMTNGIQGNTGG